MASNDETNEAEVSLLFEDAKAKLDKIDALTQKEKKQIVKDLANNLEGKIPTDTISIEIVNQLRGRVSERFIHECLDEKYKQKHLVDNAKKQKRQQDRQDGNENLAALPPLNQEARNKEVDSDGRSVKEKNQVPSKTVNTSITDSTFHTRASSQRLELKKQANDDLKECSSCKELCFENLELKEALEKATPLVTADKVFTASSLSTSIHDNHQEVADDFLEVEFALLFRDVREYLASLSTEIDDGSSKVWFSCKIDKKSDHVISAKTGRIDQQHRDSDNRGDMQNE
jgi:hypothetical protein